MRSRKPSFAPLLQAEGNFAIRAKTQKWIESYGPEVQQAEQGGAIHDYVDHLPDYISERDLYLRLALYFLKSGDIESARRYFADYFDKSDDDAKRDAPNKDEQQLMLANFLIMLHRGSEASKIIEQLKRDNKLTEDSAPYAEHLAAMNLYDGRSFEAALWSLLEFYGSENWVQGKLFGSRQPGGISNKTDNLDIWEVPEFDGSKLRMDEFDDQTALFLKVASSSKPRVEVARLAFVAAQLITKTRSSVGISRSIVRQKITNVRDRALLDALYLNDRDVDEDILQSTLRRYDRDVRNSDLQDSSPCSRAARAALELERNAAGLAFQIVPSTRQNQQEDIIERIKNELFYSQETFSSPIRRLALGDPQSIWPQDLQRVLKAGDAVVLITPTKFGTYVGLVEGEGDVRSKFIETSDEDFRLQVDALRSSLVPDPRTHELKPFDFETAARLYSELFVGVLEPGSKVKKLFIIPGQAISKLPFAALRGNCGKINDTLWLADCYQINILPAAVLYGASAAACCTDSKIDFLGVAAPILNQQLSDCDKRPAKPGDGLADVARIRDMCSVDRGSDAVVKLGKAAVDSKRKMLFGEQATETQIKELNSRGVLGNVRYIAFATHGLTAKETKQLSAVAEPSLVLTPPHIASEIDDGLLLSSEIVTLKLSADVVYLISCNSAAPDHDDTEAFTGLAMSFMAAGAKTLVVAYFPVDLDATSLLMAKLSQHLVDEHSTVSGALQSAMRDIRSESNGVDPYSHPRFWAGFTVISLQ